MLAIIVKLIGFFTLFTTTYLSKMFTNPQRKGEIIAKNNANFIRK